MIASFLLVGEQSYARSMVAALKQVHDCPVVQMTDLKSPAVVGVDDVVRIPFRVPLMLYRFKHLANYAHDEMLIVDTDVIAKKPISDVWQMAFDVGLTVREQGELYNGDGADIGDDMPFNTGVMFSRSQQFWEDCYRWLEKQSAEKQNWYGDQMAVSKIVDRCLYNIMAVPCAEFNWAPNSREDTSEARFWHYKGAIRKKWIPLESMSVSISEKRSPTTYSRNQSLSAPPSP